MRGHTPVGAGNVSADTMGVTIIVVSTQMTAGIHAVHVHTGCSGGDDPIRISNIDVPITGIAKIQITMKGAHAADFVGRALVVHTKKDAGMSDPERDVGGIVGCGTIKCVRPHEYS